MTSLPSLRKKILRSFIVLITLYGGLGGVLLSSVYLSSATTPRVIHVNYDSISAADRMAGRISGMVTAHNVRKYPAPRLRAAGGEGFHAGAWAPRWKRSATRRALWLQS